MPRWAQILKMCIKIYALIQVMQNYIFFFDFALKFSNDRIMKNWTHGALESCIEYITAVPPQKVDLNSVIAYFDMQKLI